MKIVSVGITKPSGLRAEVGILPPYDALAALGSDLVAMPTIEDFARMYINEQNGDRFFPSKGAHYTPARQRWLSVALVLWAKAHSLSMVLCLGWNSPSLQVLNAELEAQKQLVVELARRGQQRRQERSGRSRRRLH